ncbi:ABC transporter permease [Amnibacterium sp. CER49]|uniref:ABC transporter permease n=1 Tax=Amnibacterium sp. CER49 TaxID=3039161 RepID=UPI002448236E|nr:ABC transporter permease [Amnibacterium sp. CER49]MDH2443110.1 ABC transporter permease [Amnibacterium sp. CER49]
MPNAAVPAQPERSGAQRVLREILTGNLLLSVLAVLVSLVVGAVLIAVTSSQVLAAAGYFFARPADTFSAIGSSVGGAYASLFRGGVYDYTATDLLGGLPPLLNSLDFATPLIAAGLGIAIGFRAGLFNIGGQGQILIGGAVAGWLGFALHLPFGLHLVVALLGGLIGGAVWAGVVGVLKARTGAHEVIVTIMLNYVAIYLLDYLLHTPVLQAPGSNNPKSPAELPTAVLPDLFGTPVNLGFLLAIVAVLASAYLLNRSSLGFKLRAVGENPPAARTAGIDVRRIVVLAMVISGVLVGLAGAYQVLGQTTSGFTNDFDAGIGFNAITVALLGRSRPWGVFWAGILFGVFTNGGYTMQAANAIDLNVVSVVQSLIVLFIAAPPLVRAIFRLPAPGAPRRQRKAAA